MKNIRLHLTVLVLVVISEFIGKFAFKVGIGTIVLLPMLYALILGILTTLKKVKISGEKEIKDAGSLINHLLATASCRAACKDGDVLDYGAMCDIVERVFLLKEPLCPHGRPIYFMLDRMELFRKVKRIT